MPLSKFAQDKIRSLHLSKHTKSIPNGAMPHASADNHALDDMPPVPITPRTGDPLRSSFPRSRSPSPERRQSNPASTPTASLKSTTSHNKGPHYTSTALNEPSSTSPPLTSFLNDRHSASSAAEEAWLRSAFHLRLARLILTILTLLASASALGISSSTIRAYHATKLSSPSGGAWQLHLWPVDLDLRPTLATLAPSAIIALGCTVYITIALVPSPRSRTTSMTYLFSLLTALSLVLSFFSVIFTQVLLHQTNPGKGRDSIQSFTCRLYRSSEEFNNDMMSLGIPSIETGVGYPAGFKRVCVESEAAGGLVAAVLGLALVGVAVVGWGWKRQRSVGRAREERWEGKWSGN
jgi:hypothetical protein